MQAVTQRNPSVGRQTSFRWMPPSNWLMFERRRPVQDQRHGQSVLRLDSCIYQELLSISRCKVGISQRICEGRIEQHSWRTSVETTRLGIEFHSDQPVTLRIEQL